MAKRIRVTKSDPPESKQVLAKAIVDIGRAAKRLHLSGLNQKGVIALLHDGTKVPKGTIKTVLDGMRQLENWYC